MTYETIEFEQADGVAVASINLATGDNQVVFVACSSNDLTNARILWRLVDSQLMVDFTVGFQLVRHTYGDYRRGQWRDGSAPAIRVANHAVSR